VNQQSGARYVLVFGIAEPIGKMTEIKDGVSRR